MFTYYYWYDNYLISRTGKRIDNRIPCFRVAIISTIRSVVSNRDQILAVRKEIRKKAACIAK